MKFQFLIIAVLLTWSAGTARAQTFACDTTSGDAIALKKYVIRLVTASAADTARANARAAYNLPADSATSVTLVSSTQICQAAGQEYHQIFFPGEPAVSTKMIVVRVGTTRYIVEALFPSNGDAIPVLIFDEAWNELASFVT